MVPSQVLFESDLFVIARRSGCAGVSYEEVQDTSTDGTERDVACACLDRREKYWTASDDSTPLSEPAHHLAGRLMAAAVHFVQGCVALTGERVESITERHRASFESFKPGTGSALLPPHITLFSKEELRTLADRKDEITTLLPSIHTEHVVPLGVGRSKHHDVCFVVLVWNAGQLARKALGLAPKQFHITLSRADEHNIDKGYRSLAKPLSLVFGDYALDELDQIWVGLNQYDNADLNVLDELALHMCVHFRVSEKGFLRYADTSYRQQFYKRAMFAYGKVLSYEDVSDKLSAYCVRMIYKCSNYTEWGCVFGGTDWEQMNIEDDTLRTDLIVPWSASIVDLICSHDEDHVPNRCVDSRERVYAPINDSTHVTILPRFFRWIVPFHFAVMSTPRNEDDIALLSSEWIGIRHVVTLTEETPLSPEWFRNSPHPITHTFLPIPNYHAPSIEQMDLILRLFQDEEKLPILVHCGGGKGRAGTVAACFIAAYGFARARPDATQLKMSAADAIDALRVIRPGSIETQRQGKFVHNWCSAVWKRQSVLPVPVPEPPPCDLEVVGSADVRSADLLVLVGLPGSGKSHFARSIVARTLASRGGPGPWLRISQDESGSRAFCETEIGRSGNSRAILDRCNSAADDRRYWLSLATTWARNPVCVWFDYDSDLCISRAQSRLDHPTLPPGGRVRAAVASMKASLVPPSLDEGFSSIFVIRSFEAANALIHTLCPSPGIFKFPRTPHLFNLGAATGDDIISNSPLLPAADENPDSDKTVIITEKIDGANMGISLDADHAFVVQNRSHYITSNTHVQFSKLDAWLATPRVSKALQAILGADTFFPERYILFGEWMRATHSVPYTKLPDPFIAFDLYDRSLERWATRDVLERIVGARGISLVPLVERSSFRNASLSQERLTSMVERTSRFYDGRVEGVYVKLERGGVIVQRGKVVRGDFIAGNDHWTKGIMKWNTIDRIAYDYM